MNNLFSGITAYGKAVSHISKHSMWGWVFLPGLLSMLVGAAVFWAAWSLSDNIGGVIDNVWAWEWGRQTVGSIAQVFGGLLVAALGFILFKQLIIVLLGPFMSVLSEKVESQLTGRPSDRPFTLRQVVYDISRGLRLALRNIVRELLATLFLLLLGLFPLFSPFTAVLIFALQAYYAGFGNLDFALERHYNYSESIRYVHRNRGLALGIGTVFMLLLFTCVGFFFALPLSTTAATIETVKRLKAGENQ